MKKIVPTAIAVIILIYIYYASNRLIKYELFLENKITHKELIK